MNEEQLRMMVRYSASDALSPLVILYQSGDALYTGVVAQIVKKWGTDFAVSFANALLLETEGKLNNE